jgi:hypothetical protein
MTGPPRRSLAAAAVIVAVLVVSTAAIVPGPWHDGPQGRSCDVCRSGHLPILADPAPISVHRPDAVEWHVPGEPARPAPEAVFHPDSPRAPPA